MITQRHRSDKNKYTSNHYEGEFNLLKGERDVIITSLNRYKTVKGAALFLGISPDNLSTKIYVHSIEVSFKSVKVYK